MIGLMFHTSRYATLARPMSAVGQKQTLRRSNATSALPPKADIDGRSPDVRFVPIADSCTAAKGTLFNQLVGANEK